MKLLNGLLICLICSGIASAQVQFPPSGGNQKSVVTQYMGAHATVTITYNSPDVTAPNGDSRKGQIWGQLVPYGLNNLGFGLSTTDNPSPWRAGANENTVFTFSHDVLIEGKELAAGSYGFHIIPEEEGQWTLIFSTNSTAWGSYFYNAEDDALRVEVNPESAPYQEWLTYEFIDRQETSCRVALKWDELSIPFTIALQESTEIYLADMRNAMESSPGFNWVTRNNIANYCLQNDINLEEALQWQLTTSANSFIGSENITTLTTLAGLQSKLGKHEDAAATFKRAASHSTANVIQVHTIGRQLLGLGMTDLALEVFQINIDRHGDVWPVNVGLARGYSAKGEYALALEHAKKALERAPDQLNKDSLTAAIQKLETGQDIN